jgi:transposase
MPTPLPPIPESQEELLRLFNTIHDRERSNRVHALFLVKIGSCRTRKAIATALHVERKAVERWITQYEQDGLQSLFISQRSRCGKKPHMLGEPWSQLQEQLNHPEGFQGYQSICTWLNERFGLEVSYQTVHRTGYDTLKGTPKVPRKSPVKKDPPQEDAFKKKSLHTT